MNQTSPLFTIRCQAISACVTPPPIVPTSLMRLLPTSPRSTIPSTYIIWPQMQRGSACCTMTLTQIQVISVWRIPMRVLLLDFLRPTLNETWKGFTGRKAELAGAAGNFGLLYRLRINRTLSLWTKSSNEDQHVTSRECLLG